MERPGDLWRVERASFLKTRSRRRRNKRNDLFVKKTENVLYDELKPIFLALRFMGTFPYSISSSGELVFELLSSATLYSVLLQLALTVGATFRERSKVESIRYERGLEGRIWVYLALILYVATTVCVPFLHWPETCKKIKYINSWKSFQNEYRAVTGKCLVLGLRKTSLVYLASVSSYTIVQYSPMLFGEKPSALLWVGPLILVSTLFINGHMVPWIMICSAIGRAARLLAQEMELHVAVFGFGRGHKMVRFRHLWLQVHRLTRDLGSCMGFSFGGHFLVYFSGQVLFTYYTLSKLSTGPADLLFRWALPLMYSLFIFGFCNAAHKACNEVGYNFHGRLQALEVVYPNRSKEATCQVQRFFEAMERHPAKITFCGFASVNRGLQTALMSALVTYMVVLVQFDVESSAEQPFNCTSR